MILYQAQTGVALLLGVLALAVQLWALVDAATTRSDAYPAAGKRTKAFWVGVTAVAALLGFVFVRNPFTLFNLLAIVAAGIYLTDVRPALRSVRGRRDRGASGPYGPW